MKIALDAMGGDHAPREIVRGTLLGIEKGFVAAEDLILCGKQEAIREILKEEDQDSLPIEIQDSREVIEMHESPVEALRKKKGASVLSCVQLVAQKKADALVTMGNTGAAVAGSTLGLRLLEGVRRPGIAVTLPASEGPVTVIDVGANIKCKPLHLFHYGIMASQYMADTMGIASPRVGLLNIGGEEEKGNELVKETHELFRRSDLNFIGNIEGQDVFRNACDVVVCEGFVGNVVLKVSEGFAGFLLESFHKIIKKNGLQGGQEALKEWQHKVDYAEYGGAILLGVDGIVVIGHGRSDARAVANALRQTARFIEHQVNRHILADLKNLPSSESKV